MGDEDRRKVEVGERIRRARASAKLTQEDLAAMIGCRAQTVHRYERGVFFPSFESLEGIATACSVTTDWLIRGVGDAPAGEAA